jgi:DNA-directed RNA polymerase omega subunit
MHSIQIAELMKKTGSTYKLVILVTRRAIELTEGAAKLVESSPEEGPISVALKEVASGRISYKEK